MPRRIFLPPAVCERCAKPPPLGESLWHDALWLCPACVTDASPGGDVTTKGVRSEVTTKWNHAIAQRERAAGDAEEAERCAYESTYHRNLTGLIKAEGNRRAQDARIVNGEVISKPSNYLKDTLAEPDLVAVESSMARGGLLLSNDVAALGLDVANTAGAANTIEKLLAHQLALAHKVALEQAAQATKERDKALEMKRLQTSARMMNTFQNGVLALHRLRTGGTQTVVVQHVHVESGAQAVVGVQTGTAPSRQQ